MPKPETPEAIVLAHAAIHAANPGRCPKCKEEPGYSPEFTATCEGLSEVYLPRRRGRRFSVRVRPMFAWYDLWVGVFIDRAKRRVYVFPLPCLGVVVSW